MSNNDEKEFRLRPRKPAVPKRQSSEPRAWSIAFKRIMHYSRMSRRGPGPKAGVRMGQRPAAYARFQRCAVRVTYTRNATRGQWRAHGRYLARESATFETDRKGAGFDPAGQGIDMAAPSGRMAGEPGPTLLENHSVAGVWRAGRSGTPDA